MDGVLVIDPDGPAALCVGQAAHAWVSGQLAAAWAEDVGPALLLAAGQHDVGMADWDLEPALDPRTGRPVGFMEMDRPTHLELWSTAPQRLVTQSLHAALLVSMHGTALYERSDLTRHPHAAAIRAYLDEQHALQAGWRQRLNLDPDTLRREQQLLFLWDGLSLALCLGWDAHDLPAVGEEPRIRFVPGGDGTASLSPWPFREPEVTVVTEGRRLEARCSSRAELAAALAAAPVVPLRFTLRPGSLPSPVAAK